MTYKYLVKKTMKKKWKILKNNRKIRLNKLNKMKIKKK